VLTAILLLPILFALAPSPRAERLPADPAMLAQLLAETVDSELLRVEAALLTAASGFETARGPGGAPVVSLPSADRLARGAAASLGLPVVVLDNRLAPLVNSTVPAGVPLPASPAAELAADALDTGRPVVGLIPTAGEARIPAVAVPVPGPAGRPIAVLVASLAPDRLAAALAAALPPGVPTSAIGWARLEATSADAPPLLLAQARPDGMEATDLPPDLQIATRPLRRQPLWSVAIATPALALRLPEPPAPPAAEPQAAERPLSWVIGAGLLGLIGGAVLARRRRPAAPSPRPDAGEQEARQALADLRAICDTIPVGLALMDPQLRILSVNRRLAIFSGLPEDALVGRQVHAVLPPLLAESVEAAHAEVTRSGRPVLDVPVAVEAAGALRQTRHLLVSCHPVRDASRRVEAVSAAIQDVTERTRAEAGRNLLVRELNHRVKNCLATVQTIAQQTLRNAGGDMGEFARGFGERIRALARAHDLLTVHAWSDADLLAVTRAALSPWLDDNRILIESGATVMLRPAQAQALVLAFNELATNASKYGALTREEGRVRLRWQLDGDGFAQLSWTETGGPVVEQPTRRGFGTRLLEQALRHDLGSGATAAMDFAPSGLRASMRFRPGGMVQPRIAA
jgi:PAS domain S-box-containing protein